jgi:hypothetical protein
MRLWPFCNNPLAHSRSPRVFNSGTLEHYAERLVHQPSVRVCARWYGHKCGCASGKSYGTVTVMVCSPYAPDLSQARTTTVCVPGAIGRLASTRSPKSCVYASSEST